jgi:acetate kinase
MNTTPFLVLNCGSSSIKYAVIDLTNNATIQQGMLERIHQADACLSWSSQSQKQQLNLPYADYTIGIQTIMQVLEPALAQRLKAVGHRVVHGGEAFQQSVIINNEVLAQLQACSHLAPLHNPANLAGILAVQQIYPTLVQVAVFDTAFHQTLSPKAFLYALPYELYEKHGIRRYGFHGISYSYVLNEAIARLRLNLADSALLLAHLGNGCSASAVLNGNSIDTSMGMTPLEGLVMGSRCGDIDPSIPIFLAQQTELSLSAVNELLNKQSGLLGISGLSQDMRTLSQAAAQGHSRAQLAIEIFCYKLAKYLAALAISLGRIDGLIFTGGIGENAAAIRASVIRWLSLLGFSLDEQKNLIHGKESHGVITQDHSIPALVIPTNEELMIAQEAARLTADVNL